MGLFNAEFTNPSFALFVADSELDIGITQLVESVEYESCENIADAARIRAINPNFMLTDSKAFQPGNEVSIWMGYGSELEHVGRVVIQRVTPNFPQEGMPTVQIVGYTKDSFMMDNEPEAPKKKKGKGGRVYKDARFSDAVEDRAGDYGFDFTIDQTDDTPHNFIQRTGVSDYEFVKGLSNLTGSLFWVEGDADGAWHLYFVKPDSVSDLQEEQYEFIYNQANDTTLLSFQPEFLIKGAMTDLKVVSKDIRTGKVLTIDVTEESNQSPDLDASDPTGEVQGNLTTASDVKLFFNNFAFNVNTNRRFRTQAELDSWARQWFRRMREQFVLSRARTIGIPKLRARQIHQFEGLGELYSGDYYFTKVKHTCSKDSGYLCDISARKVVE